MSSKSIPVSPSAAMQAIKKVAANVPLLSFAAIESLVSFNPCIFEPFGVTQHFSQASIPLHQHTGRMLDQALEGREQLGAERAIDRAVIAGERRAHQGRDGGRAIPDDDARLARAHRENRRLRRIDDGGKIRDPIHAKIGNRAGATLIFFRAQFA